MPYSPLNYTEKVFYNLKKKGYDKEVTKEALITEIMFVTKVIKTKTCKPLVNAYERFGFIKKLNEEIYTIKYWDIPEKDRSTE